MFRRKFIKTTSVAALGGLTAGCMGGDETEATETANPDAGADETAAETGTAETDGAETADDLDIDGQVAEDSAEGLTVTDRELYRTNGEVGLRGTVENTSDQPYAYVEAEVTLQDDQGEILYEFIDETEEAQTVSLPAGESWQFDVVFEEAQMAEVTNYTITLDGTRPPETAAGGNETDLADVDGEIAEETDPNFEIRSHQLTRQESQTVVTGTIANTGDETANSVEVSVTLYDENDDELGVFNDSTEEEEADVDQIAPGDTWNFDVVFQDIDMQQVDRYVVSVDSDLI